MTDGALVSAGLTAAAGHTVTGVFGVQIADPESAMLTKKVLVIAIATFVVSLATIVISITFLANHEVSESHTYFLLSAGAFCSALQFVSARQAVQKYSTTWAGVFMFFAVSGVMGGVKGCTQQFFVLDTLRKLESKSGLHCARAWQRLYAQRCMRHPSDAENCDEHKWRAECQNGIQSIVNGLITWVTVLIILGIILCVLQFANVVFGARLRTQIINNQFGRVQQTFIVEQSGVEMSSVSAAVNAPIVVATPVAEQPPQVVMATPVTAGSSFSVVPTPAANQPQP